MKMQTRLPLIKLHTDEFVLHHKQTKAQRKLVTELFLGRKWTEKELSFFLFPQKNVLSECPKILWFLSFYYFSFYTEDK